MIRDFLHRSDIDFEWIELSSDEEARNRVGSPSCMTVVCRFANLRTVTGWSVRPFARLRKKLGWYRDPSRTEYDLAIYGAGPAGSAPRFTGRLKD